MTETYRDRIDALSLSDADKASLLARLDASLDAYEARTGMVVEGARAALSTWELARELNIEAPLTEAVHAVLYEGSAVSDVVSGLKGRSPKREFYGLSSDC